MSRPRWRIATRLALGFGFAMSPHWLHAADAASPLGDPTTIGSGATSSPAADALVWSLRPNVVRLQMSGRTDAGHEWTETGFGFITGTQGGRCTIATANHVVRGRRQRVIVKPSVQVGYLDGRSRPAEVLSMSDEVNDLAAVEAECAPTLSWQPRAISATQAHRLQEVWFIGRAGDWYVPTFTGRVNSVGDQIAVDHLDVLPGTSGAPLIAAAGIIGMIASDESAQLTRATPIENIERKFREWNLPWQLSRRPPMATPAAPPLSEEEEPRSSPSPNPTPSPTPSPTPTPSADLPSAAPLILTPEAPAADPTPTVSPTPAAPTAVDVPVPAPSSPEPSASAHPASER